MDEAKMVWKLSNGEIVSIGDRVIANYGNDKYNISITDIGETYITGELDEGGEIDFYFSELEDVRIVK